MLKQNKLENTTFSFEKKHLDMKRSITSDLSVNKINALMKDNFKVAIETNFNFL